MTRARSAIAATGLRKSFGDHVVLDGIDLDVAEGTVFALLGPNGAGKTTIVQILSTLIGADAGELRVAGHDLARDPDAVRAAIGVTGQFSAVDNLLTGRENLILMADLHHLGRAEGRRRAAELLDRFDLADAADEPAATYSGGMRRRLDLAMTLVGDPRLIFLDEPTTGLDPRSRHTMWAIIRDLVAGGVTVFLTTQYLEEADQLADRIAVLDHGRLVAEGTADELKRLVPGGHVRLEFADPSGLDSAARRPGRGRPAATTRSPSPFPSDGSVPSLRALLDRLDAESIAVAGLSVHTPDLDDVFLALTGSDTTHQERTSMSTVSYAHPGLGDDAAAQPAPHAALPRIDRLRPSASRSSSCCCSCSSSATRWAPAWPASPAGAQDYLDYVTPGIILLAAAGAAQGVAISVAMDMTEGIVARFRTMAIARVSVLTGHVVGSLIQTMIAMAVVVGVALLARLRAHRRPARLDRGDRPPGDGQLRADLAGGRARDGHQERRGREQPPHAADPAALPRQRVRPHRLDAGRDALVRRVPALHADHGDPARTADGHPDRQQRRPRRRLVRRHRAGRIPVGEAAVQPRPDAVAPGSNSA